MREPRIIALRPTRPSESSPLPPTRLATLVNKVRRSGIVPGGVTFGIVSPRRPASNLLCTDIERSNLYATTLCGVVGSAGQSAVLRSTLAVEHECEHVTSDLRHIMGVLRTTPLPPTHKTQRVLRKNSLKYSSISTKDHPTVCNDIRTIIQHAGATL